MTTINQTVQAVEHSSGKSLAPVATTTATADRSALIGATGTFTSRWGEVCRCTVKALVGPRALAIEYWSGGTLIREAWIYADQFIPASPGKESIHPASLRR